MTALNMGLDRGRNLLQNPAFRRVLERPILADGPGPNRKKALRSPQFSSVITVRENSESLSGFTVTAEKARLIINPLDAEGVPEFPPHGQTMLVETIEGNTVVLSQKIAEPWALLGNKVTLSLFSKQNSGDVAWTLGIRNSSNVEVALETFHTIHDGSYVQHDRALDVPFDWEDLEWFVRFEGSGSAFFAAPILYLGEYAQPVFTDEALQSQRTTVLSVGDSCPVGYREVCEVEDANLRAMVGDSEVFEDRLSIKEGDSLHEHGGFTTTARGTNTIVQRKFKSWGLSHKHKVKEADQTPLSFTLRVCERL